MSASSISRRMESCIAAFQSRDYESALVHYFPALDKTAKRRRPKDGVGARIRGFLDDELDIISHIATRNILRVECDGMSFPQAIYKFARTSIAHEGELDPRINFNNEKGLSIGRTWNLPPSFIIGLVVAVVIAPENHDESFEKQYSVSIHGTEFNLGSLWGNRQIIREWMEKEYGYPIFSSQP